MTTNEPLDARYFYWLYKQVGSFTSTNPEISHWHLAEQLYRKPFLWFVANDDDRAADGLDLKREFIEQDDVFDVNQMTEGDRLWLEEDCSMLEMLIALSRRIAFQTTGEPGDWFWHILANVGLKTYTDILYNDLSQELINQKLDTVIKRRYKSNGDGGLFPLHHAAQDQRNIEIWYQMSLYLLETNSFD